MFNFFQLIKDRLQEPSTYAGIGAIAYGLQDLNVINEADLIAEHVVGVGTQVTHGNFIGAAIATIFGLLAIFKSENKETQPVEK